MRGVLLSEKIQSPLVVPTRESSPYPYRKDLDQSICLLENQLSVALHKLSLSDQRLLAEFMPGDSRMPALALLMNRQFREQKSSLHEKLRQFIDLELLAKTWHEGTCCEKMLREALRSNSQFNALEFKELQTILATTASSRRPILTVEKKTALIPEANLIPVKQLVKIGQRAADDLDTQPVRKVSGLENEFLSPVVKIAPLVVMGGMALFLVVDLVSLITRNVHKADGTTLRVVGAVLLVAAAVVKLKKASSGGKRKGGSGGGGLSIPKNSGLTAEDWLQESGTRSLTFADRFGKKNYTPGLVQDFDLTGPVSKTGSAFTVNSRDSTFSSEMGITEVLITHSDEGKIQSLLSYLKAMRGKGKRSEAESLFNQLYPLVAVAPFSGGEPPSLAVDIEVKISKRIDRLPLHPSRQVTEISFYDSNNSLLRPVPVRQGVMGSLLLSPPRGTTKISYRIEPKSDARISEQLIAALKEELPKPVGFVQPHDREFIRTLRSYPGADEEKAQLEFQSFIDQDLRYTRDAFIAKLAYRSGDAIQEVLESSRIGLCDTLSYAVVRRQRRINLAAFQIQGLTVDSSGGSYKIDDGHAQAITLSRSGAMVFDATVHTEELLSSYQLSWDERADALLNVKTTSRSEVYYQGEHSRNRLMRSVVEEFPRSKLMTAVRKIFHPGLVPNEAQDGAGGTGGEGHACNDDAQRTTELADTARYLEWKSFQTALDELISIGLSEGSLQDAYDFLRREPKCPKPVGQDQEYRDVAVRESRETVWNATMSALSENVLSPDGKRGAINFALTFFSQVDLTNPQYLNKTKPSPNLNVLREVRLLEIASSSIIGRLEKGDFVSIISRESQRRHL